MSRLGLNLVHMLGSCVVAKVLQLSPSCLLLTLLLLMQIRLSNENARVLTYTEILRVCLADASVPPQEKKAIREYRARHGISIDQHNAALQIVGWTEQEYEDGAKHNSLGVADRFLQALRKAVP